MKLELLKTMSRDDLIMAKEAYLVLQGLYEVICGGPLGAGKYKEYFAIFDNIRMINKELYERAHEEYGAGH